jgi:hypothetical protein
VAYSFGVLFVADRSLARWGSQAIRTRPRPGLRVTLVFAGLIATLAILELLARWVEPTSAVVAWTLLVLALPACSLCAVAIDRILPRRPGTD